MRMWAPVTPIAGALTGESSRAARQRGSPPPTSRARHRLVLLLTALVRHETISALRRAVCLSGDFHGVAEKLVGVAIDPATRDRLVMPLCVKPVDHDDLWCTPNGGQPQQGKAGCRCLDGRTPAVPSRPFPRTPRRVLLRLTGLVPGAPSRLAEITQQPGNHHQKQHGKQEFHVCR
jgi:hypothetical protein